MEDGQTFTSSYLEIANPTPPSSNWWNSLFHEQEIPPYRKTRVRSSRACIACRSRHTKCDGVEPVCTRCQLEEKRCVYTKSRRGGPGSRASVAEKARKRDSFQAVRSVNRQSLDNQEALLATPTFLPLQDCQQDSGYHDEEAKIRRFEPETDNLLTKYFECFHDAHPLILPRKIFQKQLRDNPDSLNNLLPVLKYIGALYTPSSSTTKFREEVVSKLVSGTLPQDGFSVQALLLMSIAIHCSDEYRAAETYLDKAIDIALAINLHHEQPAWEIVNGNEVLAESWRRTWWTLWSVDAIFAAISHYTTHRLQNVIGNVLLPCEDEDYTSGVS
jgi:hypothetical protein